MDSKEKEQRFFSIIIPVFNNGKVLERCLESVINQTFENIEIIIYDDGSSDNSLDIISLYEQKDSRIRAFKHKTNQSLLVTRLDALEKTKGKYVLFVDGDDYISINTCEELKKQLEMKSVDILEFAYTIIPENAIVRNQQPYNEGTLQNILLRKCAHTVWNKTYCSDLIKKLVNNSQRFYCNMTEDAYFSSLLFFYANSYGIIDIPLYYYVTGDGMSTTKSITNDSVKAMIDSILLKNEKIMCFFSANQPELVDSAIAGGERDVEMLVSRCMNLKLEISKRIEFLRIIDENAKTRYCQQLEDRIDNLIKTDDYLKKIGIRRRTIHFLKTEMHNLSKRMKR